jgi:hypothetical protein
VVEEEACKGRLISYLLYRVDFNSKYLQNDLPSLSLKPGFIFFTKQSM